MQNAHGIQYHYELVHYFFVNVPNASDYKYCICHYCILFYIPFFNICYDLKNSDRPIRTQNQKLQKEHLQHVLTFLTISFVDIVVLLKYFLSSGNVDSDNAAAANTPNR